MIIALEGVEHLIGDRLGIGAIARIIRRLAAAGLRARHRDCAAGRFEQFYRGEADGRPEEIHQTCDKECDTHRRFPGVCLIRPQIAKPVPCSAAILPCSMGQFP